MNSRSIKVLLIGLITLILGSCSRGKNFLENGDYNKAVYTVVNCLKESTNNKKAFGTLSQGYEYALGQHISKITDDKFTDGVFSGNNVASTRCVVKMYINGVRISNAACVVDGGRTFISYISANNNNYVILAADRVQLDYSY
jgi:hypothetical protein